MTDTEKPLTIKDHVKLAERHTRLAMDMAYSGEPFAQPFFVRTALGRAQSILMNLIVNKRIR